MADISIITPSFNMHNYLLRCHHSVMDQKGVSIQRIIIDGDSNDGSKEWLESQNNVIWVSEKDKGMYDAINKGLHLAEGKIIGYLNCDEQYLPGVLSFVVNIFNQNPSIDIVFGDMLITKHDGTLLAFRKGFKPRWAYILASHLYVYTCTMFFRKKIIDDGFLFDSKYKDVADADFVVRLLRRGYRAKHVSKYFSTFTWTGMNMSLGNNAKREAKFLFHSAPWWVRHLQVFINAIRLVEKLCKGAYFERFPIKYSIYVSECDKQRTEKRYTSASFLWPK